MALYVIVWDVVWDCSIIDALVIFTVEVSFFQSKMLNYLRLVLNDSATIWFQLILKGLTISRLVHQT